MKAYFTSAVWPRLARLIVRGYPRGWRRRYEEEMLALIGAAPVRPGIVLDLLIGAVREHRIPERSARLSGRIVWAWLVALTSVATLWIVFVVAFAQYGAEWFGFDRYAWMGKRLLDTRRVVLPQATFYMVPSLVVGLPGVLLLSFLRAGRRPWLARAATLGWFMLFCVWWDGTLFFSTHGWRAVRGWSPEFGHVATMIAGWLIAVWLFPRRSGVNGTTAADRVQCESPCDSESSPRTILRANLMARHETI